MGAISADLYAVVRIRKWDGTTETEIASATSETLVLGGPGDLDYRTLCLEINADTITHFKKGETLRVTVEIWGIALGTGICSVWLLHDPMNRIDTVSAPTGGSSGDRPLTSQLKACIPFIIEV